MGGGMVFAPGKFTIDPWDGASAKMLIKFEHYQADQNGGEARNLRPISKGDQAAEYRDDRD